ncbi:hypothetical protein LTR56_026209 [Elasticomyces elasticus]|nr:hypothetical protein LTR56_026209 [Elasticomyces elasticus]KAK3621615.1 hypothetical protein LTR22_025120 [Elasticomyces elasticus]KAK4916473.1 hypothetical protein LTR49_015571 [Elasticomyces elasticus]KAK5755980.1 hypothetical protein LTS12_013869 [Elasticomyces elasticus]
MGLDCSRPCNETVAEFYISGGRPPFPYRVDNWQTKDFDRFGDILSEYYNRERGRRGSRMSSPLMGQAMMMQPGMMGMQGGPGMGMMQPGYEYGGGGGGGMGMPMMGNYSPWMNMEDFQGRGGRQGRYPTMSDFEQMREQIDNKFRRLVEDYQRNIEEQNALLFGSEKERREEQFRARMMKMIQEMSPQLSQFFQMGGQMGGAGGMAGNPMMGMGMGAGGGLGGLGGASGMGGMNPMMGGQMGAPNPMMSPQMGGMFGGGMDSMRGGRRGGRKGLRGLGGGGSWDEDEDDFLGGMGRNRRRKRRGGFGDDDEDMFGGGFGQERPSPRDPPPRPRPGGEQDGGAGPFFDGGGRGRAAFDDGLFDEPRPVRSAFDEPPSFEPRPETGMRMGGSPFRPERPPSASDSLRVNPSSSPPSMRPDPFSSARDDFRSGPIPDIDFLGGSSARSPYGRGGRSIPDYGGSSRAPSPSAGPGILRSPGAQPRRPGAGVSWSGEAGAFEPEAKLSRSRSEEDLRGEADAGSVPGPRDIK